MQIMEYIDRHRQDTEPCECVILPDGSVEDPEPSHIEKLTLVSGEDKMALNNKMEKNMKNRSGRCGLKESGRKFDDDGRSLL